MCSRCLCGRGVFDTGERLLVRPDTKSDRIYAGAGCRRRRRRYCVVIPSSSSRRGGWRASTTRIRGGDARKTKKDPKTNRITIINTTKSSDETAAAHMSRNGRRDANRTTAAADGRAFIVWRHCHLLTFVAAADLRPSCSLFFFFFLFSPPNSLVCLYYVYILYYVVSSRRRRIIITREKRRPMARGGGTIAASHLRYFIYYCCCTYKAGSHAVRTPAGCSHVRPSLASRLVPAICPPIPSESHDAYLAPRGHEKMSCGARGEIVTLCRVESYRRPPPTTGPKFVRSSRAEARSSQSENLFFPNDEQKNVTIKIFATRNDGSPKFTAP